MEELELLQPLRGGGTGGVWSREMEELFRESVRAIFVRWTALALAVSHGWGGAGAEEKRARLVEEVCVLSVYMSACLCLCLSPCPCPHVSMSVCLSVCVC